MFFLNNIISILLNAVLCLPEVFLFLFILIKLFARIRRLEKTLTDLVRKQAKDEAQVPEVNRDKN